MSKPKPWRVIRINDLGGGPETGHTSRATAYHRVHDEIRRIKSGESRAVEIRIYQWDIETRKWALHETIHRSDIATEKP